MPVLCFWLQAQEFRLFHAAFTVFARNSGGG
jgi:hypothetical protein